MLAYMFTLSHCLLTWALDDAIRTSRRCMTDSIAINVHRNYLGLPSEFRSCVKVEVAVLGSPS